MENELFLSAMKKSLEAKSHVDKTVSGTMDFVHVPAALATGSSGFRTAAIRSRQVKQQRLLKQLQQGVDEIKSMLAKNGDE